MAMKEWRTINSWNDAAFGFFFIHSMTEMYKEKGMSIKEINETFVDLKRKLRSFIHKEYDRKFISGEFESWIELITLPDGLEDPDAYFREYEYRRYYPSQYDCTGQAFTKWYKIFERNGKTMVYHSIGLDV